MVSKITLHQAVETLPKGDSEAYHHAARINPSIVVSESNPDWFLRSNEHSVGRSAEELVKYWATRKKAFGEERFARSLTDLSGNGALLAADIELLQTGFMVILPSDTQGCHVICIDSSRLQQNLDRKSCTRICFFVGHCLLDLRVSAAATNKVVVLRFLSLPQLQNPAAVAPNLDKSLRIFEEVLPLTIKALHHCFEFQGDNTPKIIASIMPSVMRRVGRGLAAKAVMHIAKGPEEMRVKLQKEGIINLPESLGGTWNYQSFDSTLKRMSQPENIVDPPDSEDKVLVQTLDGIVRECVANVDPTEPLSRVNPKVHFAFGVMGMLQEEEKCPLHELLRQQEAQHVLRTLIGERTPIDGSLKKCVSDVAAEMLTQGDVADEDTVKQVSEELLHLLNPSLAQESALQAENEELLIQVSNLIDETPGRSVLPVGVQSCLGVMCLLEDEQDRTVNELLQDSAVVELLDGMLEDGDPVGDGKVESSILDLLAERIARDISRREDDDAKKQILCRLDEASMQGGSVANFAGSDLIGAMVDFALGSPTQV